MFARALHTCSHVMCYRGLHLNLSCSSTRVDLHVILFLERQFIWFLLVSLCPSTLVVIFSCALGLRNPSAFFSMLLAHSCILCYLMLLFSTQVSSFFRGVSASCFCFFCVDSLCCLCSLLALVFALIWLINQKSAMCTACTLGW